jgi:CMP-N-acetylneuraminic acid synthetase
MSAPSPEARGPVLALIPARAGSKGIPGKNVRLLAGKPLLAYAVEAALGAGAIQRVILSTDSEEIAALGRELGAETPFLRPAELAADDTPTLPVVQHALYWLDRHEAYRPEALVLLQPTAPLRTARHVDEAIELLWETGADSVVSVARVPGHFHPAWQLIVRDGELRRHDGEPLAALRTRRQELSATYWRNGAIYACRREALLASGTLYGERCVPYEMPLEISINLDSEAEWQLAEAALRAAA